MRAIAIATGRTWRKVHDELCALSGEVCSMPSVNWVWGLYLKENGFRQHTISERRPMYITVREFCRAFPSGVYVVGTGHHAVAVIDGDYYDAWDSGDEIPSYYWKKERG